MSDDGRPTEYSVDWIGPVRGRSCTDLSWLVIFLAFMGCWAGVGYYSIFYSNAYRPASAPIDSYGRRCGVDDEVANAPHLVYFDLTQCHGGDRICHTPQVCREKCPTTNWYFDLAWDLQSVGKLRRDMICETGIDLSAKNKTELKELIGANKCTKWYLKSTSVAGRCIPQSVPLELRNVTLSEKQLQDATVFLTQEESDDYLDMMTAMGTTVAKVIAVGASVCLIYLFLMRWFAFQFILLYTALLVGFFGYVSCCFFVIYAATHQTGPLVVAITFVLIAALILLVVLAMLKKIRRACVFLKEASEASITMTSTLLFPILPALIRLAAIGYFVVIIVNLFSIESQLYELLVATHILGFIWFYCFVTALSEMILASTFVTWYWTANKSDVPFFTLLAGAWRTLRYHLGTVAFGSLLLTICHVLREVLRAVCSCCIRAIVRAFPMLLKYMNRNAYIVCALYGVGLCSSASHAMELIVRNAIRALMLKNVVSWVLWGGQVLIAASMGVLMWYLDTDTIWDRIHGRWIPVLLVVIGVYLVADVFFNVYVVAVDAIFLCFLEDCERHDGSLSRPFYMSQRLQRLLLKDLSPFPRQVFHLQKRDSNSALRY